MNLQVIGVGTFLANDLEGYVVPPAWRKATRNMIFATASIDRALQSVPAIKVAHQPKVGFVLGSVSGELETTADFLVTWAKSRMARPVLFQNSLHNATTGFASIHFNLIGPTLTVSATENTPAECVELAQSLMVEGIVDYAIVTVVEGHKNLAHLMGDVSVREGACSWIVALDSTCTRDNVPPLAEFSEASQVLNCHTDRSVAPLVGIDASGFFERAMGWERRL